MKWSIKTAGPGTLTRRVLLVYPVLGHHNTKQFVPISPTDILMTPRSPVAQQLKRSQSIYVNEPPSTNQSEPTTRWTIDIIVTWIIIRKAIVSSLI